MNKVNGDYTHFIRYSGSIFTFYLSHIRNVDHLLAGCHVAHNADIQRVHYLAFGSHQAVIKLCIFVDIKQPGDKD